MSKNLVTPHTTHSHVSSLRGVSLAKRRGNPVRVMMRLSRWLCAIEDPRSHRDFGACGRLAMTVEVRGVTNLVFLSGLFWSNKKSLAVLHCKGLGDAGFELSSIERWQFG